MTNVTVVAHERKLGRSDRRALQQALEDAAVDVTWIDVPKAKKARKAAAKAVDDGADVVIACGGDGTVRAASESLVDTDTALAVLPAGTANLFATNLEIPQDIEQAVRIGLHGRRRKLDVGTMNGERFAVMAGAGFDAQMIRQADAGLKDRIGRVAYVWTGMNELGRKPFGAKIKVNGTTWFDGKASSILFGNVGKLFAGVDAFEDARPDDGELELGVVTADGMLEWARTIARTAAGASQASPYVQVTRVKKAKVTFDRKVLYELDGGEREKVKKLDVQVEPGAIEVCVPGEGEPA